MRKVAVTGGAGFIGSHLAEELARQDFYVIILDNLSSGKKGNLTRLLDYSNVEFVNDSITNFSLIERLFDGVDYVFHLASMASVPRSIEYPLAAHETNVTGTLNVLLAAKNNGVKKVIYSSSASVYGDTPGLPKREDMLPAPQSPYAASKLCGEHYCRVFHQVYGLSTVCLRYFNVYGPRQDPASQYAAVIPKFIMRVSQGRPPLIFGDGEQTRDFIFVKDVVLANILAADRDVTGVLNIATGISTTVNELAHLLMELLGRHVEPVYRKLRAGDIRHSLADISKAKLHGYTTRYTLVDGLKETITSISYISYENENNF